MYSSHNVCFCETFVRSWRIFLTFRMKSANYLSNYASILHSASVRTVSVRPEFSLKQGKREPAPDFPDAGSPDRHKIPSLFLSVDPAAAREEVLCRKGKRPRFLPRLPHSGIQLGKHWRLFCFLCRRGRFSKEKAQTFQKDTHSPGKQKQSLLFLQRPSPLRFWSIIPHRHVSRKYPANVSDFTDLRGKDFAL